MAAAAGAAAAPSAATARAGEARLRLGAHDREGGELPQDVARAARRAGDDLPLAAHELLEVVLALHARVLVDRHGASVLSRAVERWTVDVLEGRIVRREPLSPEHEEGLWHASRDPETWRWLSVVQPRTREEWRSWMENALAAAAAGTEIPLVTLCHKRVVGSTRFLELRPEHRSVEIGWTMLGVEGRRTAANTEAKYLQLRHAFDDLGALEGL